MDIEAKIKETQQKLYNMLIPSGWANPLKMFLCGRDFFDILEKLYRDSSNNIRFTPPLKDIFRAFIECPYESVRIVMVGQDPYPQADVADGILFSCSKTGKAQPSLRFVLAEVQRNTGAEEIGDVDLKRWSHQGILMLNTALTCEVKNIGSHIELWEPFTKFLFEVLAKNKSKLIYVFLGQKAKYWNSFIPKGNFRFFATHPMSSGYQKVKEWNSGDIFTNINEILKNQGSEPIAW